MSDCANVEMRERLPELLHGTLPDALRRDTEAHVASCADCAAELELLHEVRQMLDARPAPRIDTAAIVAALPRPSARPISSAPSRRSMVPSSVWRMAATVTLLALGSLSLPGVRRIFGAGTPADSLVVDTSVTPQVAVLPETTGAVTPAPAVTSPRRASLTAGGGVTDLADEDLEALIGALDRLEATPGAEPEANPMARIITTGTGDS